VLDNLAKPPIHILLTLLEEGVVFPPNLHDVVPRKVQIGYPSILLKDL